jgi:hypothetical protein
MNKLTLKIHPDTELYPEELQVNVVWTSAHVMAAWRVDFGPITKNNVGILRLLNRAIFPVHYNENFYMDIVETPQRLSKFGITVMLITMMKYADHCLTR